MVKLFSLTAFDDAILFLNLPKSLIICQL